MSKTYQYRYKGTIDEFSDSIFKNIDCNYFRYLDSYIVKKSDNGNFNFGIERTGHSGGNWFNPSHYEKDGYTYFEGELVRKISYTEQNEDTSALSRVKNLLWYVIISVLAILTSPILLPLLLIVAIKKRLSEKSQKADKKKLTTEEKLDELMLEYLNCEKM